MLPVFVMAVAALCLTIDGVVQRISHARALALVGERVGTAEWLRRTTQVPRGVLLDRGHVWMRPVRLGLVRLGADNLAAALLGEPDRIELPAAGARIARGQLLATLARDGRAIELRSPVGGVVARVQSGLDANPERVARAPFGRGWLVELRPSAPAARASIGMAGDAARRWLRDELDRLREFVIGLAPTEGVGATALDGGVPALPLSACLDHRAWAQATALFFADDTETERRS
jgi:glycine cleavage system H protein